MKNLRYILLALLAYLSTACNDLLELDPAKTGQLVTESFYVDYNGALQGINGVYASLREPYRRMWWLDVLSDDGQNNAGGDQESIDFEFQTVQPNSGTAFHLWATHYAAIYRANVFIERVPAITSLQGNQEILRRQFMGEAYFLRALCYFNLARIFGDVPLITTEVKDTENLSLPRTPRAQVLAQVEADLLEAIKTLPVSHPNPALIQPIVNLVGGRETGRATAGSAKTLLGDLYLTLNRSADAERVLLEVVNSGAYSLMPNYANNFGGRGGTKNNAESVFEISYALPAVIAGAQHDFSFQMGPVEDNNSLARNRPTDNTLPNNEELNNTLVQAFPAGDARRDVSVRYSAQPPVVSIAAKWYVPAAAGQSDVNWPVYRFSETILLLAEALQNQNKDAQALAELNKVRAAARTGLAPLTGLTGNALRDAIRLERRLELNLEGKRWFDLQRWGLLVQTMQAHGRPVKPGTGGLLPIPEGELDKNPALVQNPGY